MRIEQITSAQNPKIKNLLLLQEKSKARREQGLFVVEGRRELEHCLEAGFNVRTVFVCPEVMRERWPVGAGNLVEIPEALYRKVAYREGTEGILAEVETRTLRLEDLALGEHPLVVVLESVEKPGNLPTRSSSATPLRTSGTRTSSGPASGPSSPSPRSAPARPKPSTGSNPAASASLPPSSRTLPGTMIRTCPAERPW